MWQLGRAVDCESKRVIVHFIERVQRGVSTWQLYASNRESRIAM